jgi:hypothetical protein
MSRTGRTVAVWALLAALVMPGGAWATPRFRGESPRITAGFSILWDWFTSLFKEEAEPDPADSPLDPGPVTEGRGAWDPNG